ncbi:putative non-specific serine/threonine protein kinase [Helianthus annuus]|nr:putative non-specific serine/threonine protein kinase [Helianthus annuus]
MTDIPYISPHTAFGSSHYHFVPIFCRYPLISNSCIYRLTDQLCVFIIFFRFTFIDVMPWTMAVKTQSCSMISLLQLDFFFMTVLAWKDCRRKVTDVLSNNFIGPSIIDLSSNNFYGPITNVPSMLTSLLLSRNKFYGGIFFLCQIDSEQVAIIDLSYNSFTGRIPDCLWNFRLLRVLSLGNNNLSGRLPRFYTRFS